MRLSLPLRIFLVHLVFSVGAAALAVFLVRDSFQRYKAVWEREVATLPGELLFQPLANEIARSLLLRLEQDFAEEVRERDRRQVSDGLGVLLREVPSIRAVVVVDREGRIEYASQSHVLDLVYTGDHDASFLASNTRVRRERTSSAGEPFTEVLIPVWDNPEPRATADVRRRLGSLIVHYLPDPELAARVPTLATPSIDTSTFVLPVVIFLSVVAFSGVLIAVLTGLPVRRLDRALTDFRARGFRGALAIDRRGLRGELASAVSAIDEMGGRLEALDARGREREALLATLAQSLEEGMIALDPAGAPVAWNAAALRLLTSEPFDGAPASGDDSDPRHEAVARVLRLNPELADARISRHGARRDVELVRGDGSRVTTRVARVPFEIAPGRQGTLMLLRDLGTLRKIEEHLLEAGRYAGLAHLAAGLAHEIRNPLHAIGLNAGVVEQYVDKEPTEAGRNAITESLNSIKDETRRLTELLNNYLGLVRPERAAGPVDLRDLSGRVQRLLSYAAAQAGVEIRLEGDESLPPVDGVASRLQQAILNLVLNSIQAMPEGGTVTLDVRGANAAVEVTVSDDGPGLPPAVEKELFEMRATTKPEGSGFGLPLARLIAEAHGGDIRYRRRPGGGASMTLRLPCRAVA